MCIEMSKKYDTFLRDDQWLRQKYWVEELTLPEIAKIIGCKYHQTVLMALRRLNIPTRTKSEAQKGKKLTEATKKKMSESRKGEKNPFYGKHHSEEARDKIIEANKHRKFHKHHTKPELIFEDICKKYRLPYKYTGDGSFWIKNINPDFVDVNGKKIAIEIFGDYWHSPILKRNIKYIQTYDGRKKTLKKYGWEMVVLWESDLLREDAERFVLSALKKI